MRADQDPQTLALSGRNRFEDSDLMDEGGDAAPKKGLNLGPILRMVRRNIVWILIPAAIGGGAAVFLAKSSPLVYEGSFEILVEPITSQGRSTDPSALSRDEARQEGASSVDYPTLLQVLQSPEMLSRIATKIQEKYPDVTLDSLQKDIAKKNLVIERVGTNLLDSTRTIHVSYKGEKPERVQFLLEEMKDVYLNFSLEDRKTNISSGVEFIEDQLPKLQERVSQLEAKLQDLKQRYRITNPTSEGDAVSKQLRDVQTLRMDTQRLLSEQESLFSSLKAQLNLTPNQGLAAAALTRNPRYQDVLNQLKRVQADIEVKLARFNEESPIVQSLRKQEKNLNDLLARETQSTLAQSAPNVATNSQVLAFQDDIRLDLIRQMVTADTARRSLRVRYDEVLKTEVYLDQQVQQFPSIVRQYNDLQQQLDIATKSLNQLLLQRETLRVEAAQKKLPWETIAEPRLETDAQGKLVASRGKSAQTLPVLGLGAGLVVGLALALLLERWANVFRGVADVKDAIDAPLLGTIPREKGASATRILSYGTAGSLIPLSADVANAFGELYTNLRFLSPVPNIRSMVVSSASSGDGKTAVALNLAQTAASMGQRVLLVDANLRSPDLHNALNLPTQKGLVDLLQMPQMEIDSLIQPSELDPNLSVLAAGIVTSNSFRVLASHDMKKLMQQLQQQFDLVIYDAPKLEDTSDTNFLAAQTDGILMVVGINQTKQSVLKRIVAGLKDYRLPILGVVANHSGQGKPNSYGPAEQPYAEHYRNQGHSALFGKMSASTESSPQPGDLMN